MAKQNAVQKSAGGKDIRAFFNARQSSTGKIKSNAIEISDDDNRQSETSHQLTCSPVSSPVKLTSSRKPTNTPKPASMSRTDKVMTADSDDDFPSSKPAVGALKRKKAALIFSSDEDDERKATPRKKKPVTTSSSSSKPSGSKSTTKPSSSPVVAPKTKAVTKGKKRVKDEDYSDSPDEEDAPVQKRKPSAPSKSSTVKPPAPAKPKFNWVAAKAAKNAGPIAHGSKEVPEPASMDCLAGLAFVFTGELTSFSRDEAVDLAKRYGGRVVGQPSSKTSYVVLGENAGPSKLAAIKKHNLQTINEDEFLNLIGTRVGPSGGNMDEKMRKKMEKDDEVIKQGAKELEKREKRAAMSQEGSIKIVDPSSQLWTVRYAPQSLKEIVGNKGQVEKLQQWLHDWPSSLKSGFKKPGKNGMNVFRGVMITGPPGIGKTTSAHLCAKLEGYTPIEMNASDSRSKKLVENGANIMNESLDKWMHVGGSKNAVGVEITSKSVLIMDEVDGMSAGDRGGVGALAALIRKTSVPIICIANDRSAQKLKPLLANTFGLGYKKPEVNSVRSRILTIAFKEKLKVPANVIDQLINGAQSDIRQVLNMLSTWKLSNDTMDFDEGKALARENEKYAVMTPFNITSKLLGPYTFSATSRETLGDKMELYFHDHSFMPLFIQENYLKTTPALARTTETPPEKLKLLELMDRAASSISDGDLVDSMIHGPEQHWSLMPLHAVCSTIRPASQLYGMIGYGGPNAMGFPQWLGQNSKQNKLSRQLADIQVRMRLKVSGDKLEIRQHYIPALFPHVVKPLIDEGASVVEEVIDFMDEYYLSKDDWDTIVELGVNDYKDDLVMKKISTATKTSLTKKYNSRDHPVPFYKAQDLGKIPKKLAAEPAPDLEEAYEVDDDGGDDDEDNKKKPGEIESDKLIRKPKKKSAPTKAKK